MAAFLGARAFITESVARQLGWQGTLGSGEILAVLPSALVLAEDGTEVEVLDQGYTVDDVEIGVRLPDGQRTVVSAPERADSGTVRVRLIGGAPVPA